MLQNLCSQRVRQRTHGQRDQVLTLSPGAFAPLFYESLFGLVVSFVAQLPRQNLISVSLFGRGNYLYSLLPKGEALWDTLQQLSKSAGRFVLG